MSVRRINYFDGAAVELGYIPIAAVGGSPIIGAGSGSSEVSGSVSAIAAKISTALVAVSVGLSCSCTAGPVGAAVITSDGATVVDVSGVAIGAKLCSGASVGSFGVSSAATGTKLAGGSANGEVSLGSISAWTKISIAGAVGESSPSSISAHYKVASGFGNSVLDLRSLGIGNPLSGISFYPLPGDVRAGITYGPNGNDYTGTLVVGVAAARVVIDIESENLYIPIGGNKWLKL